MKGCFGSGGYDAICNYCISANECEKLNEKHSVRKEYGKTKWFLKRKEIIAHDKKCVKCGTKHSLNIHHIIAATENFKLFYDNSNLQTLCESCHIDEHNRRLESHENFIPYESFKEEWRQCGICGKTMFSKYETCYDCEFGEGP